MARLVQAACPRCGAGVKLDPSREYVTCAFCGTSSFIRSEKSGVAASGPAPPGPVIYVEAANKPQLVLGVVVTCIALAAGLIAFVLSGSATPGARANNPPPTLQTVPAASAPHAPCACAPGDPLCSCP